mgnify:CR=1 FL=1
MSTSLNYLRHKNFAIYGLGVTGRSVIRYFNKYGFKNYVGWDDDGKVSKRFFGPKYKRIKSNFLKTVNFVDYIIVSPGININKAKLKKILLKNKHKIITDLDLFYLLNPDIKSIVVTGTNGKSTTCKIIEHVLRKNNINVSLGGNIGSPVLNLNLKKNPLTVIEASSFQLAYSKFIKPNYALILNIKKDHLDWHGSMNSYIQSKLKIFSLQKRENFALVNDKGLLKQFRKHKYASNLKFITSGKYKQIKNKIKNNYLSSEANEENMSFVYTLSKILKVKEKSFIRSLKSFKGLPHRHEIFYKKNNKIFVNDSKATSFEASRFALKNNKNIFWIVGGLPKMGDRFQLGELRKNIIKTYIIGRYMKNFKKHLKGKVSIQLSKTLNNAVVSVFKDIRNIKDKKITILLSPASASYDQFKNFEDRGNKFKKLIKNYIKKYF